MTDLLSSQCAGYSGGHFIYNLSTKSLSAGIWEIQATLDDGTVRTIRIGLSSR